MNAASSHQNLASSGVSAKAFSSRILVAVNNAGLISKLRLGLAGEGFELLDCELIEEISDVESISPELILIDQAYTDESVLDLIAEAFDSHVLEDVPVVFLLADENTEKATSVLRSDLSDCWVLPMNSNLLKAKAKSWLKISSQLHHKNDQIHSLEETNISKSRSLSIASHDLKNPLVSIRGIAQYLAKEQFGKLNDDQMEMVDTIVDASCSMLGLVEQLLDRSMIETGKVTVVKKSDNLLDLAVQSISLHQQLATKKRSEILVQTNSGDYDVAFDRRQISRVLDNLITNALKFSPSGSLVKIQLSQENNQVILKVVDQGPGIPEGEHHKLFNEFGRTSVQTTAGESSTGFGLYVSKKIMQEHGGSITAENNSDGGACFTVILNKGPK